MEQGSIEHGLGLLQGTVAGMDSKLDLFIEMLKASHVRLDKLELWQSDVKNKYASRNGAMATLTVVASFLSSGATWLVMSFMGWGSPS